MLGQADHGSSPDLPPENVQTPRSKEVIQLMVTARQ